MKKIKLRQKKKEPLLSAKNLNKISKGNRFTKFELIEKVLSEEEKVKEEAKELEELKRFSSSKEFKDINKHIEGIINEMDKLPIETRAKMLELLFTYLFFGTKLPTYLKDFILKKVVEDKMKNMDISQVTQIVEQAESLMNMSKGLKGLKEKQQYIG